MNPEAGDKAWEDGGYVVTIHTETTIREEWEPTESKAEMAEIVLPQTLPDELLFLSPPECMENNGGYDTTCTVDDCETASRVGGGESLSNGMEFMETVEDDLSECTEDKDMTQHTHGRTNEMKDIVNEFQCLGNKHTAQIKEILNSFHEATEMQMQRHEEILSHKKRRTKAKGNLLYNLIMICMMIVLLMQIHMYILLYNKFNTVHTEIKDLSCVVYGKSCPDSHSAYQSLTNKLDFLDVEHTRSMELLQRDMEDLSHIVNNISRIMYSAEHIMKSDGEYKTGSGGNGDDNDGNNDNTNNNNNNNNNYNKPPRTRAIYVNP